MGFPKWLRPYGPGLAFACLLACLPSLVLAGTGWCPLLVTHRADPVAQAAPAAHCCGLCATPAPQPGASIRSPGAMSTEVRSTACGGCPSGEWISPDAKRPKTAEPFQGSVFATPRADDASAGHSIFALRLCVRTGPAPPAGQFLQVVARRCFPALAPPVSLTLVS